ncbi:hypothetical protein CSPX01_03890 [Colletotrichum filicis]|nr:hypothetical protein CSPX01_03890 [Colletotrichum filicis]
MGSSTMGQFETFLHLQRTPLTEIQVYMGEIFPSRIREAGIAIGTSTQWLFNFVFSQATPHAVQNLGWKTFLMFCIFNWALVVFVWFFIKETKGKSLEEMDAQDSVGKHGDETEPKPVFGSIGEKL